MFFGQTTNWRKMVQEVTDNSTTSYPHVAAEYQDNVNGIRVHCGSEAQVLMRVQIYLTSKEDFDAFDTFLKRFGLPQNGYQVVNTYRPYGYSATPGPLTVEPMTPPMIASPMNR